MKQVLSVGLAMLLVFGFAACSEKTAQGDLFVPEQFIEAYNEAALELEATMIEPEHITGMVAYQADGSAVQVEGSLMVSEGILEGGGLLVQPESIVLVGTPGNADMLLREYTALIMAGANASREDARESLDQVLTSVLNQKGDDVSHTVSLNGYHITCNVLDGMTYSMSIAPAAE